MSLYLIKGPHCDWQSSIWTAIKTAHNLRQITVIANLQRQIKRNLTGTDAPDVPDAPETGVGALEKGKRATAETCATADTPSFKRAPTLVSGASCASCASVPFPVPFSVPIIFVVLIWIL